MATILSVAVATMNQWSIQPNRDHCNRLVYSNRPDDRKSSNWIRCPHRRWHHPNGHRWNSRRSSLRCHWYDDDSNSMRCLHQFDKYPWFSIGVSQLFRFVLSHTRAQTIRRILFWIFFFSFFFHLFYGTSLSTDSSKTIISLDTFNGVILSLRFLWLLKIHDERTPRNKVRNWFLPKKKFNTKNYGTNLTIMWLSNLSRDNKIEFRIQRTHTRETKWKKKLNKNYSNRLGPKCGLIITQLVSLH